MIEDWTIEPQRLWAGEGNFDAPVAFLRLEGDCRPPADSRLPFCPVIGIGDAGHPLAALCDAVLEPPFTPELIARQVVVSPKAAGVFVGLLRLIEGLAPDKALMAESLAYAALQASDEHRQWLAGRPTDGGVISPPGHVAVEREAGVLRIALDRPLAGNTIDRAMRDQLHDAFQLAALDRSIERIVLSGPGRTFSLGADLDEFGTTTDPATAHAIRQKTLPANMVWRCADRLDVHVQGGCVGSGLELAAWGRRVTASRDAWFHLPELAMGILPGAGGCVSLMRRIGRSRTALMVLSGKRINARQALSIGLIDAIVDEGSGDPGGADIG